MDWSLYVTLSPTGGPRGDPQAHMTAGSTGRCGDMTPWQPRGVDYNTEAAGAAGDGGGGTSQGWTSRPRSHRGGERGQPRLAPPGARASHLTLPGAARSQAANMAPAAGAGPAGGSPPHSPRPCPAAALGLGPWCEAVPWEEARAEA